MVPVAVLGEVYTKLRYDRRVSPRRDALIALGVFGMVEDNPTLFELRTSEPEHHGKAVAVLRQYQDQSFSYVDAVTFIMVDDDASVARVLTVDGGDFRTYQFAHHVEVVTPGEGS